MKKFLLQGIMLCLFGVATARGQCPMMAKIDDMATIILTMPDGTSVPLGDSTILWEKGTYRLWAVVDDTNSNRDTLSRSFALTGEEREVQVSLSCHPANFYLPLPSVIFIIERHLWPPEEIEIEYSHYATTSDFRGPYFWVKNGSQDTLYGYWEPTHFWGWVERMMDGVPVRKLIGTIDHNFSPAGPFEPHTQRMATIGSFGSPVPFGHDYRFHLLYSNHPQTPGAPLTRESDKYKWFTSVQSWYHLTCDFTLDDTDTKQ